VPKAELISKLRAPLHSSQLKIAAGLPDAAVLARDLQDFRVQLPRMVMRCSTLEEDAHDDLVLALAHTRRLGLAAGISPLSDAADRPVPSR
jgi:hypothetical protein